MFSVFLFKGAAYKIIIHKMETNFWYFESQNLITSFVLVMKIQFYYYDEPCNSQCLKIPYKLKLQIGNLKNWKLNKLKLYSYCYYYYYRGYWHYWYWKLILKLALLDLSTGQWSSRSYSHNSVGRYWKMGCVAKKQGLLTPHVQVNVRVV